MHQLSYLLRLLILFCHLQALPLHHQAFSGHHQVSFDSLQALILSQPSVLRTLMFQLRAALCLLQAVIIQPHTALHTVQVELIFLKHCQPPDLSALYLLFLKHCLYSDLSALCLFLVYSVMQLPISSHQLTISSARVSEHSHQVLPEIAQAYPLLHQTVTLLTSSRPQMISYFPQALLHHRHIPAVNHRVSFYFLL